MGRGRGRGGGGVEWVRGEAQVCEIDAGAAGANYCWAVMVVLLWLDRLLAASSFFGASCGFVSNTLLPLLLLQCTITQRDEKGEEQENQFPCKKQLVFNQGDTSIIDLAALCTKLQSERVLY